MSLFSQVFSVQDNSYFRGLYGILKRSLERDYAERFGETRERHHVIPRAWFRMRGLKVDQEKDNIVWLSYEDHLRIHVLLVHYFQMVGDDKMTRKMFYALRVMSPGGAQDLKAKGVVGEEWFQEYALRRKEEGGDFEKEKRGRRE